MSTQIKVFDTATGNQKIIDCVCDRGVLAEQDNGAVDTYLKLTVSARTVAGNVITPFVISGQGDLVLGTTQYDGVTTDDYASLGDAVDDYVLRIVKGVPGDPDTALDFTS